MFKTMGLAAAAALAATAMPALAQDVVRDARAVEQGVRAWASNDYAAAVRLWQPLAQRGNADALFNLGHAYRLGRGVPQDMRAAEQHYQRAAEAGHVEAQAMYGLILFQNGRRQEAMPFVKRAAEQGDARAQYVYGTALFNGDLVERDWPRAYAFMTRAATQGLPYAQSQLREMEQHIPVQDRNRGTQLAAEMARGSTAGASAAPASAPAQTRPPVAVTRPPRIASTEVAPSTVAPARETPPVRTPPATQRPPVQSAPAQPAPATGRWKVQLGAFSSDANARRAWSQVSGRLSGLQPFYVRAGNLVRLQAGPIASRAAAERVCASLSGQGCFVVAP